MEIERFSVVFEDDKDSTTLGVNIAKRFGQTFVNLFTLVENEGRLISENLWKIAGEIAKEILLGAKIDDLKWTLTSSHRTSAIDFTLLNGKPYKLDMSDRLAADYESFNKGKSLEEYKENYDGQPPRYQPNLHQRVRVREPLPSAVFCIPCKHPAAAEGVFHCVPSYYQSGRSDDHEFILVDTKKVIEHMKRNDPHMLQHADYKFGDDKVESWLEGTSLRYPRDMGDWYPLQGGGVSMSSGQADMIKVVQLLDLPYFPISVSKSFGTEAINNIRASVGYGQSFSNQPTTRPAYT